MTAVAAEREAMKSRIAGLEEALAAATVQRERAMSMAQQTRAGHVYVISNIGSFGDEVFKVGMTRRLEPTERVQELGDASVPFSFDIHAMIYTDDAPGLERQLQTALEPYRVNRINPRKEFFRVPQKHLKNLLLEHAPQAVFVDAAEAQDYWMSLLPAEIQTAQEKSLLEQMFPAEI